MLRRVRYPIHFHCFVPSDMRALLAHVRSEGAPFAIEAEDERADRFEFTIVARAEK